MKVKIYNQKELRVVMWREMGITKDKDKKIKKLWREWRREKDKFKFPVEVDVTPEKWIYYKGEKQFFYKGSYVKIEWKGKTFAGYVQFDTTYRETGEDTVSCEHYGISFSPLHSLSGKGRIERFEKFFPITKEILKNGDLLIKNKL